MSRINPRHSGEREVTEHLFEIASRTCSEEVSDDEHRAWISERAW
jgi:hypothetical protein